MKAIFIQFPAADKVDFIERIFLLSVEEWLEENFDLNIRTIFAKTPYSASFVIHMANKLYFRDLSRGENGYETFEKAITETTTYELEAIPETFNDPIKHFLGFVSIQDPESDLYRAGNSLVEKVKELKQMKDFQNNTNQLLDYHSLVIEEGTINN